jgi:hypothetical protein
MTLPSPSRATPLGLLNLAAAPSPSANPSLTDPANNCIVGTTDAADPKPPNPPNQNSPNPVIFCVVDKSSRATGNPLKQDDPAPRNSSDLKVVTDKVEFNNSTLSVF